MVILSFTYRGGLVMSDVNQSYLLMVVDDFIELFKGEGVTVNAQLQDAYRKASSLVDGVEQLTGAVKRSVPHLYTDKRV